MVAQVATGERGCEVISSLAGRIRTPTMPEGQVRVGGFGGADGLRAWLVDNEVDLVVDATHPFAEVITANAAIAARTAGVPLIHLRRPSWAPQPGDRWIRVSDLAAAAHVVTEFGERIFLTVGRRGVEAFADLTRQWFLIRAIDPPEGKLPARHEILLARGPFAVESESRLMAAHRIDTVVTKDSGGSATEAKLVAARAAGISVVVVQRPPLPEGGQTVDSVAEVMGRLRAMRAGLG
ncbi:cobalt-precorrin-6A reductase [Nocardia sp. CNY236]|uniref:cobalt-precorrin-6A reductase n=1 Tax=Nocardia sp. CNY236 TaxID=1169152 RepID=UPI0003F9674A|nr:cobalt-precorrin-6A reductase [Nocardia sp. CNY236]